MASLDWMQVLNTLAALEGERVAVKVSGRHADASRVAVFRGVLGEASDELAPAIFFPISESGDHADDYDVWQKAGVYLREDEFEWGAARNGADIVTVAFAEVQVEVGREHVD